MFNKNAVMGGFVESQAGADRPGSASVQRSAMLEVRILNQWIVIVFVDVDRQEVREEEKLVYVA